jgi:hypothetical protein
MAFFIILSTAAVTLIGLAIYIVWGLRFLAKVDAMEKEKTRLKRDLWMAEQYALFIANHATKLPSKSN